MKKMSESPENKSAESGLEKWAGGALYGVLVASLATAAGLTASFYSGQISASWPVSGVWRGWSAINPSARFFWGFLIGWVILYFVREYVKGRQVKRLNASASEIKEAVQTLPPSTFINDYAGAVLRTNLLLGRVLPRQNNQDPRYPTTRADLTLGIKELLRALGGLASTYDSRDVIYGANIMIFVPHEHGDFSKLDNERINRYLIPGFGYENLAGVLQLRKELAVVIDRQNAHDQNAKGLFAGVRSAFGGLTGAAGVPSDPDAEIHEVIFAIPKAGFTKDEKGLWRVLPGSPTAYVTQAVHYVQDFLRLRGEKVGTEYDIDPDVLQNLEEDYGRNGVENTVRSFLAVPLIDEKGSQVGTLNIHCSEPLVLGHENVGRIANFVAVLSPMVKDLGVLVSAWMVAP